MARRKSEAKQEKEFFQGLVGLAAMGLALGGYYLTKTIQGAIVGAAVGVAIVVALMIVVGQKRAERLKNLVLLRLIKWKVYNLNNILAISSVLKDTKLKLHKQPVITVLIWSFPKTGSELLSRLSGTERTLD